MICNTAANKRIINDNRDLLGFQNIGSLKHTLEVVKDLIEYNRCINIEELALLVETHKEFEEAWG